MNSYNENLNSVVVTSLQSQSLEEKSIYSKQNASMFTLYYAEGATISAEEKLTQDTKVLEFKRSTMIEAVKNTNLSNNLLASATQANQYYKQSINNMAVCAANIQVAANAIVRLASDVGSIFSIVHAADRNSDIFFDTNKVRALIDSTAHSAEVASKLAMETSAYTSEVSVPTLFDKSKSANSAINNLLQITTTDFNNISTTVNADNANLATLSAKEKLAEGILEDISIDYKATKEAYNSTNSELNLDLWVSKTLISDTMYFVSFNQIDNPFDEEETVQDYHLIFVKDSKKATFSMSNAENIRITGNTHQYIEVSGPNINGVYGASIDFLNYFSLSDLNPPSPVIDSDGENIILGLKYVVFVMAVYTDNYKREINNFEDFLSAPSRDFTLTHTLTAVNESDINVNDIPHENKTEEDIKIELDFKYDQHEILKMEFDFTEQISNSSGYTQKLTFTTPGFGVLKFDPEYRCIFLPKLTYPDLLTTSSLKKILKESASAAKNAEKITAGLEIQAILWAEEILKIDIKELEINQNLDSIAFLLNDNPTEKELKKLTADQTQLNAQIELLEADKLQLLSFINEAQTKASLENSTMDLVQANLGFYFNLTLAEQVSRSNYSPAKLDLNPPKIEDSTPDAKPSKKKDSSGHQDNVVGGNQNWMTFIGPETTDNFGNMLIDQNYYYPVILTLSKTAVSLPNNFTNALSIINRPFKFNANNAKK